MTNRTEPSMNDLAAAYDDASLACDRNPTEANRAAKNAAETALLMAQRAAGVAS